MTTHTTDLYLQHTILKVVIGSKAYRLDDDLSDTDRRGVFLPPADLHWSLHGVPETIERGEEVSWELGKFVHMAIKCNPTILECLFTDLVEQANPIAHDLLRIRGAFLSRRVYDTYGGYAHAQLKKLGEDLRVRGEIRWKHAMHMIRLMMAGIYALKFGSILVEVEGRDRERLLSIRQKMMSYEEVMAWYAVLRAQLDEENARSLLPLHPDEDEINAFLLRARRSRV